MIRAVKRQKSRPTSTPRWSLPPAAEHLIADRREAAAQDVIGSGGWEGGGPGEAEPAPDGLPGIGELAGQRRQGGVGAGRVQIAENQHPGRRIGRNQVPQFGDRLVPGRGVAGPNRGQMHGIHGDVAVRMVHNGPHRPGPGQSELQRLRLVHRPLRPQPDRADPGLERELLVQHRGGGGVCADDLLHRDDAGAGGRQLPGGHGLIGVGGADVLCGNRQIRSTSSGSGAA